MKQVSKIRRSESGVTLIELLVVIVIMAIIASVSIPSFTTIGRGSGVQGAVNNIAATLSLTRQRAISHREELTFVCGNTTNDVGFYKVENQDGLLIQSTNLLPAGVMFDGGLMVLPLDIRFRTDGTLAVVGGASKEVHIKDKNRDDITKKITVYGLTGMVKIVN